MDYEDLSRMSTYVQPDIEGYLQRKESGVLRTKTSKRWCWVQGSIFYQQKPPTNNNGPGGINVIDMSDAQSVRPLPTDATGTQFEMFMKKGQVYICSSQEECTAWIKALQKAMATKGLMRDIGNERLQDKVETTFYTPLDKENEGVYSQISEAGSGKQLQSSKLQNGHENAYHDDNTNAENMYSTPEDSTENVYSVMSDVDRAPSETVQNVPVSAENPSLPPSRPDTKSNGGNSMDCMDRTYNEGVSTGPQENNNNSYSTDKISTGTEVAEGFSTGQPRQGKYVKNENHKKQDSSSPIPARVAPLAPHRMRNRALPSTPNTSQATPPAPAPNCNQVEETINSEDQLMDIFNSMDIESTVPDLEYVITNEDARPVTDLKTFLRQNDVHCRVSTNRLSLSEDPVVACKRYLSTLENLM